MEVTMFDQETEEILMTTESEILTLNLQDVLRLAKDLNIDDSKVKDKSKFSIIKIIRQEMEEKVGNLSQKEEIIEYLNSVKGFLSPPPLEQPESEEGLQEEKEVPQEEKEIIKLEQQIEGLLSKKNEIKAKLEVEKLSKKVETVDAPEVVKVPVATIEKSFLRREFKIQGVIGEPGQKDKIGYQSLISQIEGGLTKQYSELEVVSAVVRAVQPGLQLRDYLESVSDLTLPKLRKILRFHYHEKSATELYQILVNITQNPKEDPQSFLIRALTVRQKIIFASKESGSNITYDESSVQGLFLHALETGLIDETVRAKMQPALKDPSVADEDLIEAMNQVMSAEAERMNKFGTSGKAKQASVSSLEKVVSGLKEKKEEGRVLAALKAVQSDMATMQTEMKTLRETVAKVKEPGSTRDSERHVPSFPKKRGCQKCEEKSMTNSCDHCFICGGSNHIARYCRMKYKNQGNRRGVLPRDRE